MSIVSAKIRVFGLFILTFALVPTSATAQRLDLGGIELYIGQSVTAAISQLTTLYDVRLLDEVGELGGKKMWVVQKKGPYGDSDRTVGNFSDRDGRLVAISKWRKGEGLPEGSDAALAFIDELYRRSGTRACRSFPDVREFDGRRIFLGYETRCGAYRFTFHFSVGGTTVGLDVAAATSGM